MNIAALAHSTYSDAQAPIKTERSTEYQVFAQITHRLSKAKHGGIKEFVELASAIHENRRLWNILAVDVADDENNLPQDLRAQIFYLAEFTEVYSSRVLAKEVGTEALVDINTSIMRGLRSKHGQQE